MTLIALRVTAAGAVELVGVDDERCTNANRFLAAITARGLARATVRAYGYDLVVLYRWLHETQRTLSALKNADVTDFIATQRRVGAAPTSINRRLNTCRLLYRFCTDRELEDGPGYCGPAPYYRGRGYDHVLGLRRIPPSRRRRLRVATPRRLVEPLRPVEVRRFLKGVRRYRDLALVHLMLLCGLRAGETLALRLADVEYDEGQLRVCGKGSKERVLPLPGLLAQLLRRYCRWERPPGCVVPQLFVVLQGRHRAQPMTMAGLRSLFRHRRRDRQLARANPHRFRHTFGADMARAGVRLPLLQRLMGHADAAQTLHYIHLSLADVRVEYTRAIARIAKQYAAES
ncbi:MAG TPA: tyrosine-type recombinase/integrase [Polyangia bacterium]|jgi:site-specific recombinase XerD